MAGLSRKNGRKSKCPFSYFERGDKFYWWIALAPAPEAPEPEKMVFCGDCALNLALARIGSYPLSEWQPCAECKKEMNRFCAQNSSGVDEDWELRMCMVLDEESDYRKHKKDEREIMFLRECGYNQKEIAMFVGISQQAVSKKNIL